jgi:RNA polymerase sigma factor for flagellar operon FliA
MGTMLTMPSKPKPVDAQALDSLWQAYARGRAGSLREQLIGAYLPFARILSAKLYANRTHMEVEFDDYLQYARVGLVEAVDRFDPQRGFKFETFAASRINGAILSGLEAYSEVHEQVAARKRLVQVRVETLKGEWPDAADPAALFGFLAEMAIGLAVGFVLDQSGMYQAEEHGPSYHDNTYAGVELRQLRARVRSLLDGLPGKHRQVVSYHYLQQWPFDEIAEAMQLSRGRISQLHKEALLKLRKSLQARDVLDWSG